jgi:hypothetical protein
LKRPTDTSHAPGIGRLTVARPLFERGPEGIVQRLLGKVEVAEQSNQCGKDSMRLGAVDRTHLFTNVMIRSMAIKLKLKLEFK